MIGFRRGTAALLLLLAVMVVGCGGQRIGTVTGTVTVNGEKMEKGMVTFYTEDLKIAKGGAIQSDGTYKIDDFPAGPVKITVMNNPPVTGGGLVLGGAAKPKDPAQRNYFDTPGKYFDLPAKYRDPAASGLTYEVKAGDQVHDIPLTP
jgi:hypothetical protein